MNRKKIVDAILNKLGDLRSCDPQTIRDLMKLLSDTNLIAYAISIGVDTDAILSAEVKS